MANLAGIVQQLYKERDQAASMVNASMQHLLRSMVLHTGDAREHGTVCLRRRRQGSRQPSERGGRK